MQRIGAAPAAKPLPANWSEHKTDEGVNYWYNAVTGVSQVGAKTVLHTILL
jgi:hypothetical protein